MKDLVTSKTRKKTVRRLPRNFHNPSSERRLSCICDAAGGRWNDPKMLKRRFQLAYLVKGSADILCRAWIIYIAEERSAIKRPELTAFGRVCFWKILI